MGRAEGASQYTGWFLIIVGDSTVYNFQTGNKKIKLYMEYDSVTQEVLFSNVVLAALMSGKKYDVIPQNVRTLVFRNKVRYPNATSLQLSMEKIHFQSMLLPPEMDIR
jgi:hypothetical protein